MTVADKGMIVMGVIYFTGWALSMYNNRRKAIKKI